MFTALGKARRPLETTRAAGVRWAFATCVQKQSKADCLCRFFLFIPVLLFLAYTSTVCCNAQFRWRNVFVIQILFEEQGMEHKKKKAQELGAWYISKKRRLCGEFHHLFDDLKKDPAKFIQYFRTSFEAFEKLLNILSKDLYIISALFMMVFRMSIVIELTVFLYCWN